MDFGQRIRRERLEQQGNGQADASNSASENSEENILRRSLGKPEEALKETERVTELLPDDADAWQGKGAYLLELGKWEEALAALEKARRNYLVSYYRGVALGALRRYDEAVGALKEALRLNPDDQGILDDIGSLLEAIVIRREALKANKETGRHEA